MFAEADRLSTSARRWALAAVACNGLAVALRLAALVARALA